MILLTGGAGFVGSHVVEALLAAGHPVRILDALIPEAHRVPPEIAEGAEFVHGDLRDPDTTRLALRGVDRVCHQAGMVGLGQGFSDVLDYVGHNDVGTAVLLRELGEAPVERLVLASSMVVYGEGRYRCGEHGLVRPEPRQEEALRAGDFAVRCPRCRAELVPEAIPEDAALEPRSVYAATKVHQEHLGEAFARETGTPYCALRYHNVYGPRMPRETPYAGVASLWVSALAAGRAPRVFEDGQQLRDFVHVRDVARANLLALTRPQPVSGALNVASGTPRSIGEVAQALWQAAPAAGARPAPVVTGEYRLGDVRHVFASADRARALGFQAAEGFEAGMAEFARSPGRP